jgi:hypothetical protein
MATRAEQRKQRYQRIVRATGNVSLARQYRDRSLAVIKRDLGVDVSKRPKARGKITDKTWESWSNPKDKKQFPNDVIFYATQVNREVGADDNDTYGFIFAYLRLVSGKGEQTIRRQVTYSEPIQMAIYIPVT